MKDLSQYILTLPIVINFCLLIIMLYQCRRYFWFFLKGKTPLILSLIFAISFVLRVTLVNPKHLLYNDEFYYMFAAKNLLIYGNFGGYFKSFGWPFINAIVFAIFGINNWVSIYTSIIFGSLTSILIFLMVDFIFKDKYVAIISSLVFALMPAHIIWSATAETNAVSIFFITLCVLLFFLFSKIQDRTILWFTMLLISFTAQIRGENYILFGLFILGAFIFLRNIPCLKQNINIWFAVTVVCLCLPNFVSLIKWQFAQNWLLKETSGFVVGKNFSLQNLFINSFTYAPELLNGVLYPCLFIILFLIGFVYLWYRNRMFNLFLLLWFIVFYLIYFSAWSLRVLPSLMARSRFYIGFYPVFVIWCAGGILLFLSKIRNVQLKKIVTVILSSLLVAFFYPYDKKLEAPPDYKHILQTDIIEKAERELPGNCLIVCNYPEVLGSTTFLKIIDIKDFLENDDLRDKVFQQFDCVLFFEDLFCFDYEDTKKNCEKMKSIVRLGPFKSYSIGEEDDPRRVEYTFYKISPGD